MNTFMNNALMNLTHLPSYFFELLLFSMGLFFSLQESMKDRQWFLVYFPKKARIICQKGLLKSDRCD